MATSQNLPPDSLKQLRSLSHQMSNALEVILQAHYLLQQSQLSPEDEKWVSMIGKATSEATVVNGQIRDIVRSLSITHAEQTVPNTNGKLI